MKSDRFMPRRPEEDFEYPHLILCEGPEDVAFIRALINCHSLGICHIRHTGGTRQDRGGNSKFGEKLERLKARATFKEVVRHILIVGDCDADENSTFASICAQIVEAGYAAPNKPRHATGGSPTITVYLWPPNCEGNLECFLAESMRSAHTRLADFVDVFAGQVADANWTPSQKGKLWFRALLSGAHKPDPCINLASVLKDKSQSIINLEDASLLGLVAALRDFIGKA